MDWKSRISGLWNRMTTEKWLALLGAGAILMIIAIPLPGGGSGTGAAENGREESGQTEGERPEGSGTALSASQKAESRDSYEDKLERRIEGILRSVDGVGQVDVMVVLKSSGEKVLRVDRSGSTDTTLETDASGGKREASQSQWEESTVLTGQGSGAGAAPIVEKELPPEIAGIVVSAQGGGSPAVQSEISQAMEALFGLPAHKIKVLKRVD